MYLISPPKILSKTPRIEGNTLMNFVVNSAVELDFNHWQVRRHSGCYREGGFDVFCSVCKELAFTKLYHICVTAHGVGFYISSD